MYFTAGRLHKLNALFYALLCFLSVPETLLLSQSQQKPDISVDVKLVHVLATVRNKKGEIVRNLTKDDFTLDEDGRPQTIQYFSQESDLPLTADAKSRRGQVHVPPSKEVQFPLA